MSSERLYLAPCDVATDWTVLGNDTTGLTTSVKAMRGATCLTWAKANGAANKTYAGAYYTHDTPLNLLAQPFDEYSRLCINVNITTLTNVASAEVLLISDTTYAYTNYLSYTWADSLFTTTKWLVADQAIGLGTVAGNGADLTSIKHVVIQVTFDAESNTLAADDILWNGVFLMPTRHVET